MLMKLDPSSHDTPKPVQENYQLKVKGKLRQPLEDNRGINSATQVGCGKTQKAPIIQKKTENDKKQNKTQTHHN